MLISTTSTIQGKTIKEYRGVVFGDVINGINVAKDFAANITNYIGGRSTEYEEELINSRAEAIKEMIERAEKIGANALIGVKIEIETITAGEKGTMFIVTASGTAVVIE